MPSTALSAMVRDYAAAVTGTGNSESITQDIRDGLTLPEGQRMLVEAALLVPADAAGTEVVVHVAEQGQDGQWSTGAAVAVDVIVGVKRTGIHVIIDSIGIGILQQGISS